MVAATSDRRIPARRAARRARATIVSKSRKPGGRTRWSTMVSSSSITTNSAPGSSPRRCRIASGMTICPFDESLVVATAFMSGSYQPEKTIVRPATGAFR